MNKVKIKYLFLYTIFTMNSFCWAEIINVPGDQPTIQTGIDSALVGDTVLVEPGTYIENINFNGKNIIVASNYLSSGDTSFISQTIIDGNQSGSVVTFENGEDTTAVICGFTITNGSSINGGGVNIWFSSPSIENLIVKENVVTNYVLDNGGGGIKCVAGNPVINNSIIKNNSIYGNRAYGGGMFFELSSAILRNIVVDQNYSDDAIGGLHIESSFLKIDSIIICNNISNGAVGGIAISRSNAILNNAEIYNNVANSQGGGMGIGESTPIFNNVIIRNNHSDYRGGGLDIGLYTDLRNCNNVIVKDNTADLWGGGISIYANGDSTVYLSNVLVSGNWAGNGGGGVYFRNQKPVLNNVTIVNNTCPNRGGGIFARALNFENHSFLINCIVRNNSIEQIHFEDSELTVTHCNIEDSLNGIINDSSVVNWLNGNIDKDPIFTDTLNGDYTLQPGSPCIDTGIDYFEWRGRVWLNLPPGSYIGSAPDMGSYEFDPTSGMIKNHPISITNFYLYQNYPNPFNPETTIKYQIPKASKVKLEIFNVLGQKVKTLVDEQKEAGSYQTKWNGLNELDKQLSTGIYFYRLSVEAFDGSQHFVKNKKMLLIR